MGASAVFERNRSREAAVGIIPSVLSLWCNRNIDSIARGAERLRRQPRVVEVPCVA